MTRKSMSLLNLYLHGAISRAEFLRRKSNLK